MSRSAAYSSVPVMSGAFFCKLWALARPWAFEIGIKIAVPDIVPVNPDQRVQAVAGVIGIPKNALLRAFHAPDGAGVPVPEIVGQHRHLVVGVAVVFVLEFIGIRRNAVRVVNAALPGLFQLLRPPLDVLHQLPAHKDDPRLTLYIPAIGIAEQHPEVVHNLRHDLSLDVLTVFNDGVKVEVHTAVAGNGGVAQKLPVLGYDPVALDNGGKLVVDDLGEAFQLSLGIPGGGGHGSHLNGHVVRCNGGHLKVDDLLEHVVGGGILPIINLSPSAQNEVIRFHDWLEPKLVDELEYMESWGAKLLGNMLRIAGMLHCAKNSNAPSETSLSSETVQQAIAISKYFLHHAKCVHNLLGTDKDMQLAKHVTKKLQNQEKRELSKYQIFRLCRGSFQRVDDLNPILDILIEFGYLKERTHPAPTGGRPRANTYLLNPNFFNDK